MVIRTGGFGPFAATELTDVLAHVVTAATHRIQRAVLHDVQYRTGQYYAIAEAQVLTVDGQRHTVYYGLTTATVPTDAVGQYVTVDQTPIFIWEHPADPLLPGLPIAATPAQVQQHFAPGRELSALHTVIYRPMSRAVFQAHLPAQHAGGLSDTFFLKVLRAGEARPLYNIHRLLATAGVPVVAPIAEPVADIVALAGGQGMPLGEYIKSEGVYNRFDPRELFAVLDRFPAEVLQLPHRASWADRHHEFIATAQRAMPHEYNRLARLGERLIRAHEWIDLGPIVPTHGDLYEAHILVDPVTGRIRQILDVDGAGPGYRVDDYACLIGHLAVLGAADSVGWGWRAAIHTFQRLAPHTNSRALAVRAAAVVVSLLPMHQPDARIQSMAQAYVTIAEALLDLA